MISINTMSDDMEIERREIQTGKTFLSIVLTSRDLTSLYPGLILYRLVLLQDGRLIAAFRTNTYEYPPTSHLDAAEVVREKARNWETFIRGHPAEPFSELGEVLPAPPNEEGPDVLILQGSPRPGGNSAIMASWALEVTEAAGLSGEVVFVHDITAKPCIGCYQCYNTGTCTFADDMNGIIASLRQARLLVICTPVYTSTVPAGLKLVMDRLQAYHAELTLFGHPALKKGLLLAVAGRAGQENFTCVSRVARDCMKNLGIVPDGNVFVDNLDRMRDIRRITGIEGIVRDAVSAALLSWHMEGSF